MALQHDSAFSGVPTNRSAFDHALALQHAAASVGFDWPTLDDILKKVHEELNELEHGLANQDMANSFEELGDVLFALTNLARRLGFDPAAALAATNLKFIRRFQHMEEAALREGSRLALEPLATQIERYRRAWAEDHAS